MCSGGGGERRCVAGEGVAEVVETHPCRAVRVEAGIGVSVEERCAVAGCEDIVGAGGARSLRATARVAHGRAEE